MLRNFQSFERQTVDSLEAGRIPAASYSLPGVCRRATKEITGTENKRSHFSWGRSAARIASGSIGLRQIFLPPGPAHLDQLAACAVAFEVSRHSPCSLARQHNGDIPRRRNS